MASNNLTSPSYPVVFTTRTPYPLPSQKFMIPSTWKRYQLSQLINKALSLPYPVPFDFIFWGEIIRGSLGDVAPEGGEETMEIEYIQSVLPPQKMASIPHEEWVSGVSCQIPGHLLTAAYDGHIRSFTYSQTSTPTSTISIHPAAISSLSVIPDASLPEDTHLIATSSHDLSARLTQFTLNKSKSKIIASLHLHTGPLSNIASNASGSHLLTSSWDTLIGVWDTTIPTSDEVDVAIPDRSKKRRKMNTDGEVRRKAPVSVLKGHTERVSKVVFAGDWSGSGSEDVGEAVSCGFDSTVRKWDIESGVCTTIITASEKPFLDVSVPLTSPYLAYACSTDRTLTLYDLRTPTTPHTSLPTFSHPSTPSTISSRGDGEKVISGCYDGVVRLWDRRSTKDAVASFKPFDGSGKKVMCLDWGKGGIVGVGGEGGLDVWKIGEGEE